MMSGKVGISDLAQVLTSRYSLDERSAKEFVKVMFEVVQESLRGDETLTKIKGLGTFKVTDVSPRESVHVTTGERLVIQGHSKITFAPDSTMKELVNKPFSQFDTVILNDGVFFDDLKEPNEIAEVTELTEPVVEIATEEPTVVEEVSAPPLEFVDLESIPVPDEDFSNSNLDITEGNQEPENNEEPVNSEIATDDSEYVEDDEPKAEDVVDLIGGEDEANGEKDEYGGKDEDEDETHEGLGEKSKNWPLWLIVAIISVGVAFGGGYYLKRNGYIPIVVPDSMENAVKQDEGSIPHDTIEWAVGDSVKQVAEKIKQDVIDTTATPKQIASDEEMPDYASMDQRVKYGAYNIIGTDFIIVARQGETTSRLARRTLGEEMECYIEVYNGFSRNQRLDSGQEVKIPKLQLKKKKKKTPLTENPQ